MKFRQSIDLIENALNKSEGTDQLKQFAKLPEVTKLFADVSKHPEQVKQLSRMLMVGLGVKNEKALAKKFFHEIDTDPTFAKEIQHVLKQFPTLKDLFKELAGHVVDAHFVEEALEEVNRAIYTQQYASAAMRNAEYSSNAKVAKFTKVLLLGSVLALLGMGAVALDSVDALDKLKGIKDGTTKLVVNTGHGAISSGYVAVTGELVDLPTELALASTSEIQGWIDTETGKKTFDTWVDKQSRYGNLELLDASPDVQEQMFIKAIRKYFN